MSLVESVSASLAALEVDERDAGARELAMSYATLIDAATDPWDVMERLGPKLHVTLESLGLTPRARTAATKGAPSVSSNPLDELRGRRARRTGTD
jgi:hypothetical protein